MYRNTHKIQEMSINKASREQLATPRGSEEQVMMKVEGEALVQQPKVEEKVYADEKEKRLAEFVFEMQEKRADANGAASQQEKDALINALEEEGELVPGHAAH